MSKETINIKCPRCGKPFLFYKPVDNTHNVVTCTHCGNKITLKLNPVDIKVGAAPRSQTLGKPLAAPGKPGLYYINERAVPGQSYTVSCGCCGRKSVVKAVVGVNKSVCAACGAVTGFAAPVPSGAAKQQPAGSQPAPAPVKHTQKVGSTEMDALGEIVWGRFFAPKHFTLRPGIFTLGRKDTEQPSDIQIDDPYASRRSVSIEVMPQGTGYSFKLVVLKTTNPVFVNSNDITAGNSIYLNFGDTITLGRTKLTFKKAKTR